MANDDPFLFYSALYGRPVTSGLSLYLAAAVFFGRT